LLQKLFTFMFEKILEVEGNLVSSLRDRKSSILELERHSLSENKYTQGP
jgi:hypothetical protein